MRPPAPSRPLVPDLLSHRLVRSSPERNSPTSKPPLNEQGWCYHSITRSSAELISLDAMHFHPIQKLPPKRTINILCLCPLLHILCLFEHHILHISLHLCFLSTRRQWCCLEQTAGGFIISGGLHQLQKDLGGPHHSF